MQKVLFLPLLQMASGHHQVADALIYSLEKRAPEISCRKVEFLSYVNQWMEKAVTELYLKWIYYAPQLYKQVYKHFACKTGYVSNSHLQWYEKLFEKKMEQLLKEEEPDLIICTHAFPSFLVSRLKEKRKIFTPVINVYTDFFINNVWGRNGIDYHFVPSVPLKDELISKLKIAGEQIIVTGIPVDECFEETKGHKKFVPPYTILISGGSNGLGNIPLILQNLKHATHFRIIVLCGKNEKLIHEVASWGVEHIQPIPFVSSREEMNKWYEQADAVITKPGGITISEALCKKLPIFIHSALPGQEEINLRYLVSQKLAHRIDFALSCEKQLFNVLNDEEQRNDWHHHLHTYNRSREAAAWKKVLEILK
ncbi:MGDG synthase family glycosyltransferase [Aneurinibacillus tyrosinisolvens]|uniref:MGDG synthase family glycosyltransferase n=1 Tax=Aneurinibacillus tyrosinisolvens TaxID=1443435 RepID=UPI00063F6D25|nr:hypothetical protein [Aneurinibacillus tyrosinisolvens]